MTTDNERTLNAKVIHKGRMEPVDTSTYECEGCKQRDKTIAERDEQITEMNDAIKSWAEGRNEWRDKAEKLQQQNTFMLSALKHYIAECKECHGQREYDVLVYHGIPPVSGHGERQHVSCRTCTWAQDVIKQVEGDIQR